MFVSPSTFTDNLLYSRLLANTINASYFHFDLIAQCNETHLLNFISFLIQYSYNKLGLIDAVAHLSMSMWQAFCVDQSALKIQQEEHLFLVL